jgi:hypothetical protein
MPALGAGIHVLFCSNIKDVDGTATRGLPELRNIEWRKSGKPDLR